MYLKDLKNIAMQLIDEYSEAKSPTEDEDIKHNVKILVYPERGICSVDSIEELEVIDNSKFREI